MKKLKFVFFTLSLVLVGQYSFAQEEDINSAENKAYSNFWLKSKKKKDKNGN